MKKIYILLYVLMFNAGVQTTFLSAQTPTFYNNNVNSPSNSFPWATTAGKETQYLILPGELTGASLGNITTVYFQVTASQSNTWSNLTIKLGQTTLTGLPASIYTGSLTTCYFASSVSASSSSAGWLSFTLTTPFLYDPTLSLIVDVSQCSCTNASMLTTNVAKSTYRRTYINAASCSFTYSGQDMNVFNFGVDLSAPTPPGPAIPPISGFAYNILTDTAWLNSPYILVNTSTNAMGSYWDITGYSNTYGGNYVPFSAPRVCVTRWNTCYIDTINTNFKWTFSALGYYKVKLKTANNYGSDSITKIIVCALQTKKPTASFFSTSRTVGFTDQLNYYDLSLNGPTQWSWWLDPAYIGVNTFAGAGLPNTWYSQNSQNPYLYALDGGVFNVCLAVGNNIGWDTLCRTGYLTVNNGYMMCNGSDSVSKLSSGYVYDAGGPTGNYSITTTGTCPAGFRIAACADTIKLDIERFKLLAGDSVTIRVGGPSGAIIRRLGGQTLPDSLRHYKVPGGFAFLQMSTTNVNSAGDSGFAIHWSSVPASYSKPKASFTMTTNGPLVGGLPSVYVGFKPVYTSTSVGVNMSYSWDTNGDGVFGLDNPSSGIDSIVPNPGSVLGAGCKPFLTPGIRTVCVKVYNCVGADTACKQITVLPLGSIPVADMTVNRNTGFTTDTFRFYDASLNGPNQWLWTFSPANVAYLNGTSATSQNPVVFLNSATCYVVTLRVTNSFGTSTKVSSSLPCWVNVGAYNSPGTQNPIPSGSDVGISRVRLGSIDTTTALQTPVYTPMYNQQKTTLYRGVDYTVTTYRQTNGDPMTTKVWIDYNMNALFNDPGETIINETRQYKVSTSQTFRIPNNTPTGNTRMRVGISYDITTLTPDYAQIGCFEDYGIVIGVDNIAPVVSLIGPAVFKMEVGHVYTEPGATAFDNLEGDISAKIIPTGHVDVNTVGYYTLTYSVADLYGNISVPVTRIVQVEVNHTGPSITLNGADTMKVGVFYNYTELGAVAKDNTGKDISDLIVITGSVNKNVLGTYPVTYKITDAFGFIATKVRTVIVVDTTKPVIASFNGKLLTDIIRYQIGTPYTDQVSVTDNYWPNLTAVRTGSINTNVIGSYTLLYNVTDGSGNQATTYTLVVKVDDLIPPTITLNGASEMTVDVKTVFVDPLVSSSDNYSNVTVTKVPAAGPNMNTLNTTTIVYTACDASQNCVSVSRIVHVVDRIAPVITLIGENPYIQTRYQQYVDPGVTISDNYYTESVLKTPAWFKPNYSQVSNDKPGLYYVTFNVTDPSGNISKEVRRTVIVQDMFLGVNQVDKSGQFKLYPNPSNGKFTIELENNAEIQSVKVYNIIGSLVKEITVKGNNKMIDVDMTGMSEGVYILRMEGAGKSFTQKINIVK